MERKEELEILIRSVRARLLERVNNDKNDSIELYVGYFKHTQEIIVQLEKYIEEYNSLK